MLKVAIGPLAVNDDARPGPDLARTDLALPDLNTVHLVVDPDKLMGRAEIEKRLNVGYSRGRVIMSRPDFPRPIKRLTGMKIWDGAAVEAWIAEHRPPKDDDDTEA